MSGAQMPQAQMLTIAIASCAKSQDVPEQPVWATVQAQAPDALLLLGDNVYLDENRHQDPVALAADLRALYAQQLAEPHFAALLADMRARGKPVVAIYDDHDFLGNNRCGGDVADALRQAARAELVRALAPAQTGDEVYRVHRLGLVDLVVLDARFHRVNPQAAGSDRDALLGAAQWRWLEQQVAASTAPYLLVASSTTLHTFADESWEQYPGAFARLVQLLKGRPGALLVSGDVHRNAVYDDSGVIEVVSSAVARRGIVFGALRQNHGLLQFAADRVRVQLLSLKVSGRFDFDIPLSDWRLP